MLHRRVDDEPEDVIRVMADLRALLTDRADDETLPVAHDANLDPE